MPSPIRPVHQSEDSLEIFHSMSQLSSHTSDLQRMLLGDEEETNVREAKRNTSTVFLEALERIADSEDEIITAATTIAYKDKRKMYRVPSDVPDHTLLGLKTEGLIAGTGRLVHFTKQGVDALRGSWLNSQNEFFKHRKKQKFEYDAIKKTFATAHEMKLKQAICAKTESGRNQVAQRLTDELDNENWNIRARKAANAYIHYLVSGEQAAPNIDQGLRAIYANAARKIVKGA
jgi:hypothetical protein